MLFGAAAALAAAQSAPQIFPPAPVTANIFNVVSAATQSASPAGHLIAGALINFDLPAQTLAGALSQYAFVTQQPVLYPSEMAAGRTSTAVQGRYRAEEALQMLLTGTGLAAEKVHLEEGDAVVLKESAETPPAAATTLPTLDAMLNHRGYPGLVQLRVLQALCADARVAPGHYGALFRFRIDEGGALQDAHLLDSTGDPTRDRALLGILQHIHLDGPPPRELAQQAMTMAVLPDGADVRPACGGARQESGG